MNRFACPCCGVDLVRKEAKELFLQLEEAVGPLDLTSAYRCPKHNEEIGGAKKSTHMIGVAFDVLTKDPAFQKKVIREALRIGFKGIGRGSILVHMDMRKFPEFWIYKN